MIKVFVSSTSRDLGAYRQKAIEAIKHLGFQPVAMDYFDVMSPGSVAANLKKLDESDLYVGIFAHRYGFIEPDQTKAVTELEFDHASSHKIDRLCFVIDSTYPWAPDAIDRENYAKLEQFKHRLANFHDIEYFTTADDFGYKLFEALEQWKRAKNVSDEPSARDAKERIVLAPPRPGLLIGRDDDLRAVRERFRDPRRYGAVTVVRGWPGVGKTTLITTIANDETLDHEFPDGVLWASIGQTPNVFGELKHWALALGKDESGTTIKDLSRAVKLAIGNRRFLFIVDDVWDPEIAAPFLQTLGSNCAVVFTTRDSEIAQRLGDFGKGSESVYALKPLRDDQALELMKQLAPNVARKYSQETIALVKDLEGLPLAIRVAGSLLHSEMQLQPDVRPLIEELRNGSRLIEEQSPEDRGRATVGELLRQSTERLEPDMRLRFALLGALAPKPATFPLDAMAHMWKVDDPMPAVRLLTNRGLLEPLPSVGRFQMHALLVMHAKDLLNDEARLTAPVRHDGAVGERPVEKDPPPGPFRDTLLRQLRQEVKALRIRQRKGEHVEAELNHREARILRLGGKLD